MNKENFQIFICLILMISAYWLIWSFSNGWVVLGLLIAKSAYTKQVVKPLEDQLTNTTTKLETLEAENNELRRKVDFLLHARN
ncbi:TPA: hypothetical protein I7247_21930 [Vibrio vulnificus]|nr:hypothetical protein [Vibrio vulnificus]HDY7603676.1 hypothetical protein [Vibrio vulnificus]